MIHRKPGGSLPDDTSSVAEKLQRQQRRKLNTL
jgi:hypothetical protein